MTFSSSDQNGYPPEPEKPARNINLEKDIVVTCHCGETMIPVISGPDEILFMCNSRLCELKTQVNVMTWQRALELNIERAQEDETPKG